MESSTTSSHSAGTRYSSPSLRKLKFLPFRFLSFSQLDKELLIYKLFYFLFYSSLGTTLPFFPRYYQQIGFTSGERLGLLTMRPLVQGITAPFWGLIVDVTSLSKKRLIQCCLLAWLIIVISVAFIEPTDQACEFRLSNGTHSLFINRTKVKAGFFKRSLETNHFSANHFSGKMNGGWLHSKRGFQTGHGILVIPDNSSLIESKQTLFAHLQKTLAKYSEFDVTKSVNNKSTQIDDLGENTFLHGDTKVQSRGTKSKHNSMFILKPGKFGGSSKRSNKGVAKPMLPLNSNSRDHIRSRARREIVENQTQLRNKNVKNIKRLKIQRHVNSNENKFNITSKNVLNGDSKTLSKVFNKAFWLVIISEVLLTPVLVLVDSSLLQCLGETKWLYGQTRAFSSCGYTIFFISVSALLSHSVRLVCSQMYADFVICFCIFFVCTTATLAATTQMKLPVHNPSNNIAEKIKTQLHNSHFLTLMAAVIFLGFVHSMLAQVSLHGCVNCPVPFQDDMNLQIARGISELIGFCLAGCVIQLLGSLNVIFACVVVCNLNIFFSSFLRGTCRVVLMTIIDGGVFGVVWSVLSIYFSQLAPEDSPGTLQGLLQCFYWGLGSGLGTLISSSLYLVLGLANMLRISAIIGALVCVLFTLGLRSLRWQDRGYHKYLFSYWQDSDSALSEEEQSENRPLLNGGKKPSEDGEDSGEDSGIESLEHDFEKIANEVAEQEAKKTSKKLTYARYSPTSVRCAGSASPNHKTDLEHKAEIGLEHKPKTYRVYEHRSKSLPSSPSSYPSHNHKFDRQFSTENNGVLNEIPSQKDHKHSNGNAQRKIKLSPSIPAFNQMVLHRPKMTDVPLVVRAEFHELK